MCTAKRGRQTAHPGRWLFLGQQSGVATTVPLGLRYLSILCVCSLSEVQLDDQIKGLQPVRRLTAGGVKHTNRDNKEMFSRVFTPALYFFGQNQMTGYSVSFNFLTHDVLQLGEIRVNQTLQGQLKNAPKLRRKQGISLTGGCVFICTTRPN